MRKYTIIFSLIGLMLGSLGMQAQKCSRTMRSTLVKPKVLPPTHVTPQGFTANWEPTPGAEAYCVFVYTGHTAKNEEKFTLLYEDFDGIDFGSVDNPVWGEEMYETLDAYTRLPNWSVYGYTAYAQGMVGGVVYTPYLDLRNDDGKYDVALSVYGQSGEKFSVVSEGKTEQKQTFVLEQSGLNTQLLSFDNGSKDTFIHMVGEGPSECYLDEFQVTQRLQAGDQAYVLVDLNEAVMADRHSADFKKLRFAPGADEVYYDLYAVVREYNDPTHPDRYEQIYSDYSDMMKVVLNPDAHTGVTENLQDIPFQITKNGQGATMTLARAAAIEVFDLSGICHLHQTLGAGKHILSLKPGSYLFRVNSKVYKVSL